MSTLQKEVIDAKELLGKFAISDILGKTKIDLYSVILELDQRSNRLLIFKARVGKNQVTVFKIKYGLSLISDCSSHDKEEKVFVVQGEVDLLTINPKTLQTHTQKIKSGGRAKIKKGITHQYVMTQDVLIVCVLPINHRTQRFQI